MKRVALGIAKLALVGIINVVAICFAVLLLVVAYSIRFIQLVVDACTEAVGYIQSMMSWFRLPGRR